LIEHVQRTILRLAPVPLAHADDTISALLAAELATKLTHGGADTLAASRYLAGMLVGAVRGENPFRANTPEGLYCPPGAYHDEHAGAYGTSLTPAVIAAARGEHAGPRAGFSAIECFDAALWAVRSARNFEDAVTRAVALGEDADTVGAVAGQLAGAIWGHRSIPARWTAAVAWHDRLVTTADALLSTSGLLTAVRTTTGKGVPL
jgi:ADP-ribosylglycohydrolase